MTRRRFVALDRDGTIIVEREYLSSPDQVELLPHAARGLQAMRAQGLGLVVITNQSGVGRGYFERSTLDEIHDRLRELLAAEGIMLDGIYVCPHAPEEGCQCRKPLPTLLQRAAEEHGFDCRECLVIGDKPSDIEMGQAVQAATLLVRTGHGARHEAAQTVKPDYVADDLLQAAEMVPRWLANSR